MAKTAFCFFRVNQYVKERCLNHDFCKIKKIYIAVIKKILGKSRCRGLC